MPRSVLLGRRRVSVTTYEHDEQGRLVRAITVHDPEWLDDDRDWAAADQQEQASRCEGCGFPRDETTNPDNEFAYVAAEPLKCHACAARTRKRQKVEDPRDHIFYVRKVR